MKELHNHIFSDTTCISKETMLKFINKQLSKNELHKVETHMLDCELCTDAYEGMAYAENSSMLFAIDSQIDSRIGRSVTKSPIMRNLMVAASIMVIVFGTYFSFTFFNETINNEENLVLNKVVESNQQERLESIMSHSTGEVDLVEIDVKTKENRSQYVEEELAIKELILVEQIADTDDDEIEEELSIADIIVEEDEVSTFGYVEEVEELAVVAPTSVRNTNNVTVSTNEYAEAEEPSFDFDKKALAKKVEKGKTSRKREKNLMAGAVASAPAEDGMGKSTAKLSEKDQKILVIDGYKVVNYLEEYQGLYDAENDMFIELNSVSAGFESKLDKDVAQKETAKVRVEITYKETLENAIKLYKNKQYRIAISEFDNILAKHPKEVNAQFYAGLCYYYLGQNAAAIKNFDKVLKNKETEFNEETNWYKALTLVKMKAITKAKKLLKIIVQENGFYKVKAEEELKGL